MATGRIIYMHGRGHNAPRSQAWRVGLQVGLARAGYDVAEEALKAIALPVKYGAYLNPGVEVSEQLDGDDETQVAGGDPAGLEVRNEAVRARIGPGLAWGAKSKVIGKLSKQQTVLDQMLKQRFADVSRYLDEPDRRRRILQETRQQLPDHGRVLVVGHSLGSVITLDLVSSLWPDGLYIDGLVTIGSPAGLAPMQKHLHGLQERLPVDRIGFWINVFDSDDPITGGAGLSDIYGDLVVDHHVENGGIRDSHDVDRYLEHITPALVLAPIIAEYLGQPERPERPLPDDPLQAAAWLDRGLGCRLRDILVERTQDRDTRAGRLLAREHLRVATNNAFELSPDTNVADHLDLLAAGLPTELRLKVLIELGASRPFAPFDVDVSEDELFGALVSIAEELGWSAQFMQDVHNAVRQASKAQDDSSRLGAAVVGGVAVVAAALATGGVGLAAAPGLAGAAAIASGLSGLGSLVGGSMAAGLFVTAGAGAAAPGLALAALRILNPGQTLDEVVKIHAEALVHRWEDRPRQHDLIVRDLERLLDEAERSVRLHRSVESGMRSSDSTKVWRQKADMLRLALDDLKAPS